ncbi:MAG: PAS domain-containing protein, partial [Proteobacteria bacterium]|nr:PAS domain-containing protein [Pseudomonadota bacterium]
RSIFEASLAKTINGKINLLHLADKFEFHPDGALITSTDLTHPGPKILYCNRAFVEIFGFTKAELIGNSAKLLQDPGANRRALVRFKQRLIERREASMTITNYHKDGEEFTAHILAAQVTLSGQEGCVFLALSRKVDTGVPPLMIEDILSPKAPF